MTNFTINQLKNARVSLGYNQAQMAARLKTPLRTYTGYEAGESKIPGAVVVAVELLLERDKWVMNNIMSSIDKKIAADHPFGIMSVVGE